MHQLSSVLKEICLKDLGIEDPELKESHKGKSLLKHVEECVFFVEKILRHVELDPVLKRLVLALAVVHDVGKASPEWKLSEKRIKHSEVGALLLSKICNKLASYFQLEPKYVYALIYLVWRHHSALKYPQAGLLKKSYYFKRMWSDVKVSLWSVLHGFKREFRSPNECLRLADVMGIFKLADIVSAANIDPSFIIDQYVWSYDPYKRSIGLLKTHALKKTGKFDEEKFSLQSSIAGSPVEHLIVAAPTGWGKSALAVLRIGKLKPMKVFYTLPTITAIKEFYEKLREIFGEGYVGEYFYFADVELLRASEEEYEHLLNLYRYFIPKVTITTIDQVLFTALQVGKYHLRRFNFNNALFILDEFHLLTPQMMAALGWSLKHIQPYYKFKLLFMSATPAGPYVEYLKKICGDRIKEFILEDEYRKLKRHKIETVLDKSVEDFLEEHLDLLNTKLSEGRRLLVIVNTVDRAINVYDLLKESFKNHEVNIIHSRFAYKDRLAKEDAIRGAEILVSTQVAEVSLDISFDMLVTDLAPLPSLIQRFGRVNRYGKRFDEINVWICMKLKSHKPYTRVEVDVTGELLKGKLVEALEKRGERAYIDQVKDYWEYLSVVELIEDYYKKLENILEATYCFYHVSREDYENVLSEKLLGREPNILVVPELYREKIKQLLTKLKGERNYSMRRRLLAQIKRHLAPVPLFLARPPYAEWDEELGSYVVKKERCPYTIEKGFIISREIA
ncbi:MAG: CRISPR-associated helicase Cas3' [Thermoprotei archaeon]|nr:MAG: CRISPR-associated helicase Cas3' [Thermoprotei archaeon]